MMRFFLPIAGFRPDIEDVSCGVATPPTTLNLGYMGEKDGSSNPLDDDQAYGMEYKKSRDHLRKVGAFRGSPYVQGTS